MDSNWEFDCPQFVDFTTPHPVDDEADKFFDTKTNLEDIGALPLENGEPEPAFETPIGNLVKGFQKEKKSTPVSSKQDDENEQSEDQADVKTDEETQEVAKNRQEETLEEGKKESEENNNQETVRPSPRRSVRIQAEDEPSEKPIKQSARTPTMPRRMRTRSTPFKGTPSSAQNSAKKTTLYGRSERTRSASCDRPKSTPNRDSCDSTQSEGTSNLHANVPSMKPKLAAMSPSVLRKRLATTMKAGGGNNTKTAKPSETLKKTSEQLELERIQKMREDLERQKQQFRQTFQKAMTAAGAQPVRSKIPATRPKGFTFSSDQRLTHERSKSTGQEPPEFSRTLRSNSAAAAVAPSKQRMDGKAKPKLTMPQPFNLSQNRKRKNGLSDPTEPLKACERFKSVAEQVNNYAKKTPDRFRTSRRSGGPSPAKQSKVAEKPKLTIPKTPNFQTKTRLRPVTVMSQAEIEEKELEEIKKYKFKANPINEKILSSTNVGVKPVPPKEPTVPVGFDLETDRRRDVPGDNSMEQEEKYEFHARPVPKSVLNPPVMKPLKLIAPTVPESPAFALKNRLRPKPASPENVKEKKRSISRPVPCPGIPFAPVLDHRVTEIEPFSFEQRTEEMKRRKEMLIQQKEEEERQAREFHANPMPDLSSPDHLPAVPRKVTTIPEPFDLSADTRGAKRAEEWAHKMQEEMKKQRELATFHAKPVIVTKVKPFEPKKSNRPVTDITDFELNTQRRAADRSEFERWRMEKEQEEAEMLRQKQREQEQHEKEEIERLRQEATFKANSVRHYRPVEVRASTKNLTVPTTPRFSERLRTRSMRM